MRGDFSRPDYSNVSLPNPMNTPLADSTRVVRFAARTANMRPSAIREILKVTESPDMISFAGGLPAPELFPVDETAHAAQAILATDGARALQYSTTEGHAALREWVARHVADAVGLNTTPDHVLITHGSQQGLDLIAKVLIDPGDVVLVENPAYLGALQAFRAYEANVVGVASDADGMQPASLQEALARAPVRRKCVYLIPNFQNPTGTSFSAARRAQIARIAAEAGLLVVEDDPYGRLRFSGDAAPALVADRVPDWVYLGTTSKILAPGLRVAWLVASDMTLREKLVTAKQASDLHTSTFTQRLAYELLQVPGWLDAHVAKLRAVYGKRRDLMLAALERHLPSGCSWTRPAGGLFLWVTLPEAIDATELLKLATRERVAFVPGEPFWVGAPKRNTLRLNFSNATEEQIASGIARLGAVIAGM
jgi:2-aminoadipate transaminase